MSMLFFVTRGITYIDTSGRVPKAINGKHYFFSFILYCKKLHTHKECILPAAAYDSGSVRKMSIGII